MATGRSAGGGVGMNSVIAQLGEQRGVSGVRPLLKPVTGKKPTPAVGGTPTASSPPGRAALKPTPVTAKPTRVAADSSTGGDWRPPIAAAKPTTSREATTAQPAVTPDLLSPSRLKPTVPVKSPVVSPSTSSGTAAAAAVQSTDDPAPVPPWQNLVKKRSVQAAPSKDQTPATNNGLQESTSTANSTSNAVDDPPSRAYDAKNSEEQSAAERPKSSANKVSSLKQAFEGSSDNSSGGSAEGIVPSNRASAVGRSAGSMKKIPAPPATPVSAVEPHPRPVENKPALSSDRNEQISPPPRPPSNRASASSVAARLPPRSTADAEKSGTGQKDVVVGADGLRYRRLSPPGEPPPPGRGPRKPAKPPTVDLSRYLTSIGSGAADAEDDDTYDDATVVVQPPNGGGVTMRGSAAAGRQASSSVVSQIAEYTEEEEEMERKAWGGGGGSGGVAGPCAPVSESSDDVYDDVGATEPGDVEYEDDDLYQELD